MTIPLFKVHVPSEVESAIGEVLNSGQIAYGENVEQFEVGFREFIGNANITSTGDLSSSLALSLFMAGVRPDDEVVASPLACLATNMPILNLFAKVKWCDVDPLTGNLDAADLAKKVSPRTKAILLFHWAGNPADLESIYEIANQHGIPVVEDASEALGAEYHGKKIGNTGSDCVVYSFYPNRHLTTIEGSAIAFKDSESFERGLWLKRYGIHTPSFRTSDGEINPKSDIRDAGWNTCLNHICATIGVAQLPSLTKRLAAHSQNGRYLDEALEQVSLVDVLRRPIDSKSVYWVYTLLCNRREELAGHLRANGIQVSKVHLRNDVYSCFGTPDSELPGVDEFSRRALSVPCGWWVSDIERETIAQKIAEFV